MNDERKFGVFIIESLSFDDEANECLDGFVLSQMLGLCGIHCEYYFIRTKLELQKIMPVFEASRLKYLHVSCHGNSEVLELAFDTLKFSEFSRIVGPFLSRRRLFLSACEAPRLELAKHLIPRYGCVSLMGSPEAIEFSTSGVFWSSFYYLMHKINRSTMRTANIREVLRLTSMTFDLRLNYFSKFQFDHPNVGTHLKYRSFHEGSLLFEKKYRAHTDK